MLTMLALLGSVAWKTDGATVGVLYTILLLLAIGLFSLTWPFDCVTCCVVNTAYGFRMHSVVNLNIMVLPC
jgi:hypothetical protein